MICLHKVFYLIRMLWFVITETHFSDNIENNVEHSDTHRCFDPGSEKADQMWQDSRQLFQNTV